MKNSNTPYRTGSDPAAQTQPVRTQPAGQFQPPPEPYTPQYEPYPPRPTRRRAGCFQTSCLSVVVALGVIALAALVYLLAPLRTNFLVLGIDRVPDGTAVGRSDTIILASVVPLRPDVSMLSIPRDLWVEIPGVGENRINTAHFFAEANLAGSGPLAALDTVEQNFGVDVPYYVRVKFDGFLRVIDAMGGLTVDLPEDMGGYSAGVHQLNSDEALAFARDRKGADDFFRMAHAQILIRAAIGQMLSPATWARLPEITDAVRESIDTNLPVWAWPRIGLAIVRAGNNIDSQTIGRDMVTPFTTSGGAQVLQPNWEQINPLVDEMFK